MTQTLSTYYANDAVKNEK